MLKIIINLCSKFVILYSDRIFDAASLVFTNKCILNECRAASYSFSHFDFRLFDVLICCFCFTNIKTFTRIYIVKSACPLFSKFTKQCTIYMYNVVICIYVCIIYLFIMVNVCVNAINAILIHRYTTINDTLFIRSNEIFQE